MSARTALRPQPGSLADPLSAASGASGSVEGSGSVDGRRVLETEVQRETERGSARAVLDFHGVLDVDLEASVRKGRAVFTSGVSEAAQRHLRSALLANPRLQILVLSYIGRYSGDRRRETQESVDRLRNSLGDLGRRIAFEICDSKQDKPVRCRELCSACLVEDNPRTASWARECVDRSFWFSVSTDKPPRGVHQTFDWGEVASYLAKIPVTPTPRSWHRIFD